MKAKLKFYVALMLLLSMQALLVGCNTMEGLGQDVEALGENVEEEAEENKTY